MVMRTGSYDHSPWFHLWPQTKMQHKSGLLKYVDDPFGEFFGAPATPTSPLWSPSYADHTRSQQCLYHGDTENNGASRKNLMREYFARLYDGLEPCEHDSDEGIQSGEEEEMSAGVSDSQTDSTVWNPSLCLTAKDKKEISRGLMLSDKHMYAAQKLLRRQFPHIGGLQDTCLSQTSFQPCHGDGLHLQIHHTRGNHWVVSAFQGSEIAIYDSIYDSAAADLEVQLGQLYPKLCENDRFLLVMMDVQKQKGSRDCGLFAIANALELCNGHNPEDAHYDQRGMRRHLLECFETQTLKRFPQENCYT